MFSTLHATLQEPQSVANCLDHHATVEKPPVFCAEESEIIFLLKSDLEETTMPPSLTPEKYSAPLSQTVQEEVLPGNLALQSPTDFIILGSIEDSEVITVNVPESSFSADLLAINPPHLASLESIFEDQMQGGSKQEAANESQTMEVLSQGPMESSISEDYRPIPQGCTTGLLSGDRVTKTEICDYYGLELHEHEQNVSKGSRNRTVKMKYHLPNPKLDWASAGVTGKDKKMQSEEAERPNVKPSSMKPKKNEFRPFERAEIQSLKLKKNRHCEGRLEANKFGKDRVQKMACDKTVRDEALRYKVKTSACQGTPLSNRKRKAGAKNISTLLAEEEHFEKEESGVISKKNQGEIQNYLSKRQKLCMRKIPSRYNNFILF